MSLQKTLKEENDSIEKFTSKKTKLFKALDVYLANPENKHILHNVNNLNKKKLENQCDNLANLIFLLNSLNSIQPSILECENKHSYYEVIIQKIPLRPISFKKLLETAFMTGVGTIGSLIGASAGISGVLGYIGVFTSFASIPIVGWGIIGTGLLIGVMVACASMYKKSWEMKRDDIKDNIQDLSHDIKKIVPKTAPMPSAVVMAVPAPVPPPTQALNHRIVLAPLKKKAITIKAKAPFKPDLMEHNKTVKTKKVADKGKGIENKELMHSFFLHSRRLRAKIRIKELPPNKLTYK